MSSIKQLRLLGLITSAAAIAAFGVPSTALAGKSHHLSPYKVEQHVELEGEDNEYTIDCKAGDIAIDGMWRIDGVDQDNDWQDPNEELAAHWAPVLDGGIGTSPDHFILKSVRPLAAYADAVNKGRYHFEFTPLSGADVQLKLFLTCLPQPLTGSGHTHNWQFTTTPNQQTTTTVPTVLPAPNAAATETGAANCPAKTILIQPGFRTTSTEQHLIYSRPYPSGPTWNGRRWGWTFFQNPVTAPNPTLTWRCIDIRTSVPNVGGTHTHRFVFNKRETEFDGSLDKPEFGPQQTGERQQHCGEHYKALLGGFDITESFVPEFVGPPHVPAHMGMYFLGMDPRPKTRAFRFVNLHNASFDVTTAAVCFKDRTT